jgi:hypothetical protein
MKKYSKQELSDWITGKAKTPIGMRRKILANEDRSRDNTVIGKLFFFSYDPKWKDILPVYDRYPLVFPIEKYSDGFLGLNIHYLSYAERIRLFDLLTSYASNRKLSSTSRLKLSYDLISGTKKLNSLTRPCVKRYLFGHVRSRFIEIEPSEWDKAAQLPLELFVYKR